MRFISSPLPVSYALIHEYINSINSVSDEYICTYSSKGRKHVYYIENRHLNNFSTVNEACWHMYKIPRIKIWCILEEFLKIERSFPQMLKAARISQLHMLYKDNHSEKDIGDFLESVYPL